MTTKNYYKKINKNFTTILHYKLIEFSQRIAALFSLRSEDGQHRRKAMVGEKRVC